MDTRPCLFGVTRTRRFAVADPDCQIRGGGPGHPDPEIRGGGLQKNLLRPFGPHFGLKIRGGPGP